MLHLPVRNYAEYSTQKLAILKKNPFTLITVEELQQIAVKDDFIVFKSTLLQVTLQITL